MKWLKIDVWVEREMARLVRWSVDGIAAARVTDPLYEVSEQ
jgi:hypothetical protein